MTQLDFKSAFDEYQKSVFQTDVDLRFWKHFMTMSIERYKSENPINRWINEAGFSLYNIQPDGLDTWLHSSKKTYSIEIKDLEIHSDNFFIWVMNLAIVRIYNSVELLLLQAIQLKYFPELQSPALGKKETNKMIGEIRSYLKTEELSIDTTNNRYLIEFIKSKSSDFKTFLEVPVNVEWKTKWKEFFEFFSIIRNVITHHAMIVSKEVRNNLNSIAKDVFKQYFVQTEINLNAEILKAKDEHHFLNFVSQVNDFAANTIRFIAGEKDFVFIGLHKV